jgi:hypothetical protein
MKEWIEDADMSKSTPHKNDARLVSNVKHNIVSALKDTMNVKQQIRMHRKHKETAHKLSLHSKYSVDSTKRGWNTPQP